MSCSSHCGRRLMSRGAWWRYLDDHSRQSCSGRLILTMSARYCRQKVSFFQIWFENVKISDLAYFVVFMLIRMLYITLLWVFIDRSVELDELPFSDDGIINMESRHSIFISGNKDYYKSYIMFYVIFLYNRIYYTFI